MKKERLYSLDTLRGFDMFWIIGGSGLMKALAEAIDRNWLHYLAFQMEHVEWEGFRFFDLIFPLFMFISGVAIPFAITGKIENGISRVILVKKIFRRMVLLIILGLVYNGVFKNGFSNMRVASVLAQIGIAYFLSALIVIYTKKISSRIYWLSGILLGITFLQLFTPVPGYGAGILMPEGSINAWIDQRFLPGRLRFGFYDPLGILCIVSATSITLSGTLAGNLLRTEKISGLTKTLLLMSSGIILIIMAGVLSPVYPVIKNIWTVTFSFLSAGISLVLLSVFYFGIDVRGWHKWTLFFKVIGMNSITIYLGTRIIDFGFTSKYLFGWLANMAGNYGPVIVSSGVIFIEWILLYYLYRNRIFLKV